MLPRVVTACVLPGYRLELRFTNGEVGIYDCSVLLDFGVFRELANADYFAHLRVVNGTVAWPHEQDICRDTLYLDSVRSRRAQGV